MRRLAGLAVALALLAIARPADAVEIPTDFVDEPVGAGLVQPVNFDFLPDGRVLLVERTTARIRLVVPGAGTQADPVGTIPDVVAVYGEQGLLGITVDPRWPVKPYVYVHHTCAATPNIKVVRYALTGDLDFSGDGTLGLDTLSRREVLSDLPSDFNLHNGGTIEFGPDECLYVAIGDDGIRCAAQDRHQLRGKILRLDVRGIPDGPGPTWPYSMLIPPDNPYWNDPDPRTRLVWHRGLRNPWSFDIEPNSGRMAIADVGETSWEEIDVVDVGGRNFGWPVFQGSMLYDPDCEEDDLTGLRMPVFTYPHPAGGTGASVILGGICIPADEIVNSFPSTHWGNVFFLDLIDGRLRRLVENDGTWTIAAPLPGQPDADAWGTGFVFVTRMRFGRDGGLWYVKGTELRRITHDGTLVGVPDAPVAGARTSLGVLPNPAPGAMYVDFAVARPGDVRIDVFDARGRHVRTLADERAAEPGVFRRAWDGSGESGARVPPGLYFVRLESAGERLARRVVVLAR